MLDKVRIRAFASFVKSHGIEALLDRLEKNERAGVVYHYPGKLVGDYDLPETEDGVIALVLNGKTQD